MSAVLSGWRGKTKSNCVVAKVSLSISHKNQISSIILSNLPSHSALYMQSLSKMESRCFFTQNVLQFILRGKCVYFLLHSASMWTDKTVTRRLLLFSFVTGKRNAARDQVKQDKLKNPQAVASLETTFRNSSLSRSDTHSECKYRGIWNQM